MVGALSGTTYGAYCCMMVVTAPCTAPPLPTEGTSRQKADVPASPASS